jgi:hypothetical protein
MIANVIRCLFLLPVLMLGAVLEVGPGKQYPTLKSLPAVLAAGDIVEIDSGVYRETKLFVGNGTAENPIIIRGKGPTRPIFDARGILMTGTKLAPRTVFEFTAGHWVLEFVECRHAHNGDQNAGCSRAVSSSQSVTIRNIKAWNNDMGVQSSQGSGTTIVEDSDIGWNGPGGKAHNLYLHGEKAIVRRNHIHNSLVGQNVKIRARIAEVSDNYIHDSMDGEVAFVEDPVTLQPGSDATMTGNRIVTRAERPNGNRARVIYFGHEHKPDTDRFGTLYMRSNTIVARNPNNIIVQLVSPNSALDAEYNTYSGTTKFLVEEHGSRGKIIIPNYLESAPDPITPEVLFGAPANVTASVVDKSVRLTWDAQPGASHYRIYRSVTQDGKTGANLPWGASEEPEYHDVFGFAAKTYNFEVSCVDASGNESARSPVVTIVRP